MSLLQQTRILLRLRPTAPIAEQRGAVAELAKGRIGEVARVYEEATWVWSLSGNRRIPRGVISLELVLEVGMRSHIGVYRAPSRIGIRGAHRAELGRVAIGDDCPCGPFVARNSPRCYAWYNAQGITGFVPKIPD